MCSKFFLVYVVGHLQDYGGMRPCQLYWHFHIFATRYFLLVLHFTMWLNVLDLTVGLNSCRQYYIQSRTVSSPYVSVQGCKAFLIIIGSVGQLKRGIDTSEEFLLYHAFLMKWTLRHIVFGEKEKWKEREEKKRNNCFMCYCSLCKWFIFCNENACCNLFALHPPCRYCQIGNAVAFPVARALGYMLGMAFQNQSGNEALATLPLKFSHSMV